MQLLAPAFVAAQSREEILAGGDPRAVPCLGQRVSLVVVRSQPPLYGSRMARVPLVARTERLLHTTTRPSALVPFLLLRAGDACDDRRRLESERLLRAQQHIADARIVTIDDGEGGVILDVRTVDEISVLGGLRARQSPPHVRGARLGVNNFMGEGIRVGAEWGNGLAPYRDAFGGEIVASRIQDAPVQFTISGMRYQLGGEWNAELSHPFLTDFQQIAWRVNLGSARDYVSLLRRGDEPLSAIVARRYADVGGVFRVGRVGNLALFGGSVSTEEVETASESVIVRDSGAIQVYSTAIAGRYPAVRANRLNALVGFRDLSFVRVTGFDALEGAQDVREGYQVGALLGRGFRALGASEEDLFGSLDAYAGVGNEYSFLLLEGQLEGRRGLPGARIDAVRGAGRVAWYRRWDVAHTMIAQVDWGLGTRQRVPVQLQLDDRDGGIRGFRGADVGGASRLVGRLEDRWYLGRIKGAWAVGVAPFADVGRMWAGDVPFGYTTPLHASVGVALLAAVPPSSQRGWRLEIARALTREVGTHGIAVRLVTTNANRAYRMYEPRDIARSRSRTVPTDVFVWP